jgi:hypothetical protein
MLVQEEIIGDKMTEKTIPQNKLIQEEELDRRLAKAGSIQGLVTSFIALDEAVSYLQFASNEEIESYFKQKKVSYIRNKEELNSFYNHLKTKIGDLIVFPDERIKSYFEKISYSKRTYLESLVEMPSKLANLEAITIKGFNQLKPKFKEILNYIWESVMDKGFKMEEDGEKALAKYKGGVIIHRGTDDETGIDTLIISSGSKWDYHDFTSLFNLTIFKEKIEKREITTSKKILLWDKKIKRRKKIKVTPEKGDFFVKGTVFHCPIDCMKKDYCSSVGEAINQIKIRVDRDPNEYLPQLPLMINTFLSLPNIMQNYLIKRERELKEVFK